MKTTIVGRHIELDDNTREYAEKKLLKTETFFGRIIEANMVLSAEKHRRIAEVTLSAKKMTFHATEETENLNSAIDSVMEKIEVQIKRYKEKLKDHKRRIRGAVPEIEDDEDLEENEYDDIIQETKAQIIKVRKFAPKPMTVEEAVMQLGISEDVFLVFSNSQTERVNVVYKRNDGNYGWIEPDF